MAEGVEQSNKRDFFFIYLPKFKVALPALALVSVAVTAALAYFLGGALSDVLSGIVGKGAAPVWAGIFWSAFGVALLVALTVAMAGRTLTTLAEREECMIREHAEGSEHFQVRSARLTRFLETQKNFNSTTLKHLNNVIGETEHASNNILGQTEDIDRSMHRLLDTLKGFRSQCDALADKAKNISGQNAGVIESLRSYIERRLKEMDNDFQVVQELNQNARSMANLVHLLKEISDQTNLLALNASIEAARAGEHGRGFAVVADEVRKLSTQSEKAASHIGDAIVMMASKIETQFAGKLNRQIIERESTLLSVLEGQLTSLGDGYKHMDGLNRSIVETFDSGSHEVAEKIIALLSNIQFQDITRQHLDLVSRALTDLDIYIDKLKDCTVKTTRCGETCSIPELNLEKDFGYYKFEADGRHGSLGGSLAAQHGKGKVADGGDVTFF